MKEMTVNEIKRRCILAIMNQKREEMLTYEAYIDAKRCNEKFWVEHCSRRMDEAHAGTRALVTAFETMFEQEVPNTDDGLYNLYLETGM